MGALPGKHELSIHEDGNAGHKNGPKHHLAKGILSNCFLLVKDKAIKQEQEAHKQ
ncbi:hypothetical protein D3C86_2138700 [compost metagenome]